MARTVDGFSTILRAARVICRMVGKYGTAGTATRGTPELAAAAAALVAACHAFEALDDFPGQVDRTAPIRPGEDFPGGGLQ